MNDLLQSKKLLENKIALTNGNIERKKKEFDRLQKEANEVQLIIEALVVERWKDQASLDAVNEEISRIPTLGRRIHEAKKVMCILPFILLSMVCFSQPFLGMEAGNRLGLNAGYDYHNVVLKAGALIPYTPTTTLSNITYASVGYQIGFITPLIGIAHYHVTEIKTDPVEIKKTVLIYSLEVGKDFTTINNIPYRLYLFGTHAENNFYGAGLRIYIK
jgi:hypothetical protein